MTGSTKPSHPQVERDPSASILPGMRSLLGISVLPGMQGSSSCGCSPACQGLTAPGGASGACSRHGNTGVTTLFSLLLFGSGGFFFQHFYTSSPDLCYLFVSEVTGTNSSSTEQLGDLKKKTVILSTSSVINTEINFFLKKKAHE